MSPVKAKMADSWSIPTRSMVPRRTSTHESRRRRCGAAGDGLDPDDFRDVFGGPPRSVLLRRFSCGGLIPAATLYDEMFQMEGKRVAVERRGRRLPKFRIPPVKGATPAGRLEEGFYDDIFGSDGGDRRSTPRSKSKSSSVLSSEELSPLRNSIEDNAAFWSATSKLRPITIPAQRHASPSSPFSTGAPDGRYRAGDHSYPPPNSCFLDLTDGSGAAVLLRKPSLAGPSRCFSPPDTFTLEPCFRLGHRMAVASDYGSPSSVSSVMLEAMATKGVRACFHPPGDEKEAEKVVMDFEEGEVVESSFMLEIDSLKTEESTAEGAAALDEAIAWAKEKFLSQEASEHQESQASDMQMKD